MQYYKIMRERVRETHREIDSERVRERHREIDRERESERETERDRQREREREGGGREEKRLRVCSFKFPTIHTLTP